MTLNMYRPQCFFKTPKEKKLFFICIPLLIFLYSDSEYFQMTDGLWKFGDVFENKFSKNKSNNTKAKQIKYRTYIQLLHASGKIAHKNKHVVVLIFISPTVHTPNTINKYLSKVSRGLTLRIRSDHRIKRSAVNLLLSPNPYREDDLSTGLLDLVRQTWRKLFAKSAVTIGEQR